MMAPYRLALAAAMGALFLAGCHTDMWVQPKLAPLQESEFYRDRQSSRLQVPGTVARGHVRTDSALYTGFENGKLVTEFPFPIKQVDLHRGQERFYIYCSPCHGRLGDGKGMIAQRGLKLKRPPASYHTDRLRAMPVGHFFDVITNGYGAMFSYASRVESADRWRIAAYIRALQLSQHGTVADVPPSEVDKLGPPPAENSTNLQRSTR